MRARARAASACTPVWLAVLLTGVLSGCGQEAPPVDEPTVTVAPPTPAGMTEAQPDRAQVRLPSADCTASLRPFPNKAQADAAVTRIRNRGRLIVGLDVGSNLFSFRDPITGEITGFDVDVAGEVARDVFGTPSQVEYRILSSKDRITALRDDEVDIVVKTMSITCERKQLVDFSTPYLDAHQRILTGRDSPITSASALPGRRVCAVRDTTSAARLRQISPAPQIIEVVTWADCLVALQQRQVDAVSTDDSILAGLVSQDPYLHIVGQSMNAESYGIGVNLDDPGLVRFVNGTLERIRRDGTWNTLYRKWLSVLGPAPTAPVARYVD